MWKSDVFGRVESTGVAVKPGIYNLIIGLVLCWGFLANWLMVRFVSTQWISSIHPVIFFVGYAISCFVGVILFNFSRNAIVSFVGYNLVVVPFGIIVTLAVSNYHSSVVIEAVQLTAVVTVVMMILATLLPGLFKNLFYGLFMALLIVFGIEAFLYFVLKREVHWIDWAMAVIFSAYIGVDWGRANRIPKTIDNAVDSAAAIYMDVINLFLRILRILGRKKKR